MGGRLVGKKAIVTAAGQGMGRAIALAYAAEGAEVHACDISAESLAVLDRDKNGPIATHPIDARNFADVSKLFAAIGPDILFNCVGYVHDGNILDTSEQDWDLSFDLNVKTLFQSTQSVLPGMIERGHGCIINMASVAGYVKAVPRRFAYSCTKAAVIGFTKSVALDFIGQGIRCNAICPGTVATPSLEARAHATGDFEQAWAAFVSRQPIGRLGKPEEVAALAVYLASDDAAFTTGAIHVIDGGFSL